LLAHGWRFSPSPASSTTKTGRHDIAEILLKVALNTKKSNQIRQLMNLKVEGLLLDTKPTDGSSAY
jgi:predicted negative regulator of RcsB-dependent stress response